MSTKTTLTLDIWDTILRRTCHPEAIKFTTARYIRSNIKCEVDGKSLTVMDLYLARNEIERAIGRSGIKDGFDDEYSIERVLSRLLRESTELKNDDIETISKELVERELLTEQKFVYQDPCIQDRVKQIKHKNLGFISDFYFDSSRLTKLLQKTAPELSFQFGYSSCDVRLNKRSSRLFDYVKLHENLNSRDWIHIGDNKHSDVEMPKKLGIQAHHYFNSEEEDKKHGNCELFSNNKCAENLLLKELTQCAEPDELVLIGRKISPLFAGFFDFIVHEACRVEASEIFFITREGEVLARLFEKYKSASHYNESGPIGFRALKISRQSLIRSSTTNLDVQSGVWRQYGIRSIDSFLRIVGIGDVEATNLIEKHHLETHQVINDPQNDEKFLALLSDPIFVEQAKVSSSRNFAALKEYIYPDGNQENEGKLIVDVGWLGSCQSMLAHLFPRSTFHGAYLGVRKSANLERGNKRGFLFDEFSDSNASGNLSRFSEILELLLSSNSQSVVGHELSIDGPDLTLGEKGGPSEFNDDITRLQNGIESGLQTIGEIICKTKLDEDDLRGIGLRQFLEIFERPPESLAELYFSTPRHDPFREDLYDSRRNHPSPNDIIWALVDKKKREKVIFYFRSMQWHEGFQVDSADMSVLNKWLFMFLFRLARLYKTYRK